MMGIFKIFGVSKKNTIEKNAQRVSKKYPVTKDGYFGKPGKSSKVRVITSDNQHKTSREFFSDLSKGGVKTKLKNGKGKQATLPDKTDIVHRPTTSTKNSPAVDITVRKESKIKTQKIHFEKEKKNGKSSFK